MAARSDQNLKISLIVAIIFVVIFAGLTLWMRNEWNKEFLRAEDLASKRDEATGALREKVDENETLLKMLGYDLESSPGIGEVTTQFDADQQSYMQTFEESSRNYRSVLDLIYEENQKIAQQESESKAREKELKERITQLEAEKDAQIAQANDTLSKVQQDLASERAKFNDAKTLLEQQRAELQQARERQQSQFEEQLADARGAMREAEDRLETSERSRRSLLEQRTLESPSFEVPDGRITYVNQGTRTVWINLGSSDSLRRQVTFSVFESDESDAGKAEKKGSIEVIRLLGEHLAEARITSDEAGDPILPGDQVYSQVWHRGKKLRFALTGLVDLDDDGRSDLQQAKDLIALNGGVVDASLEDDGSIDGEMTINTRYLVLGERPNQPSKASISKGFDDMSRAADNLGVEAITLVDFMNQMGYKPQERTDRYSGARKAGATSDAPRSFRFSTP